MRLIMYLHYWLVFDWLSKNVGEFRRSSARWGGSGKRLVECDDALDARSRENPKEPKIWPWTGSGFGLGWLLQRSVERVSCPALASEQVVERPTEFEQAPIDRPTRSFVRSESDRRRRFLRFATVAIAGRTFVAIVAKEPHRSHSHAVANVSGHRHETFLLPGN